MTSSRAAVVMGLLSLALVGCNAKPTGSTRLGVLNVAVMEGTAAPALESSWNFGTVTLGHSSVITVDASNVGQDPLTLLGVTLQAADTGAFYVRAATVELVPGAHTTCTVTFSPVKEGEQTARLVFDHDADTAIPALTLTGKGQL
jgi:hypothetical protein